MNIGFIGAGKVGCTLGKFFVTHGLTVIGYYSRSLKSANEAAQFTQTKVFHTIEELVKKCDVLFLTVPDRSLTEVFFTLKQLPIKEKCICHCSGILSAKDAFPGIEAVGAFGYSVHPLFAVSNKYHAYEELADVFFVLEGDSAHLPEILSLFADCKTKVIPSHCKTAYHTAAVFVSNLVIGLMETGLHLMQECGFTEAEACTALTPLIEGNIHHLLSQGAVESLTGPVERCDIPTIEKHLTCLTQEQKQIYCALSRVLVDIAQKKHPHTDYTHLLHMLKGEHR